MMGTARVLAFLFILLKPCRPFGWQTEVPVLPETWWGPGNNETANIAVRPFRINFSDELIRDLKYRLNNTRSLVPALEGVGWTYGVDGSYLPTIVDYWLNKYDFKEREEHLNQFSHFVTNIQGLDIHFIHVKPKKSAVGKRVLPLLLQHGWPGSVVEFYKLLPLMITPRDEHDFVFEVIVPSLPGFGFSSSAVRPGLGCSQAAVVLKNLMLRLGFEKFYYQGGDLGSLAGTSLATLFPQHVLGLHSNLCVATNIKVIAKMMLYSLKPSLLLPEEQQYLMYPLLNKTAFWLEESGYLHIQATKPDTVGVGLSDSPIALAAYILEKFSTGTDFKNILKKDGGLLEKFSADDLIDNLMMYWAPNSATTAMRIYADTFSGTALRHSVVTSQVTVPTACAQFPNEFIYQPEEFLKERFVNLLRATLMPRGGHFAALEEPELLANDIWDSIAQMEHWRKNENSENRLQQIDK